MDDNKAWNTIEELQKELANLINQNTLINGFHQTLIPPLCLIRTTSPIRPLHTICEPSLYIVAQGVKSVSFGKTHYQVDFSSYMLISVPLPVVTEIVNATAGEPFLCVKLSFTHNEVLEIIKSTNQLLDEKINSQLGYFMEKNNAFLLDALIRLLRLLASPKDIPALYPLIKREILYRILQEEQSYSIKQFVAPSSQAVTISEAISLIHDEYNEPLRIEELAGRVNMSASALHCHFKKVTSMSPLHYQKHLRLLKARHILYTENAEAALVGSLVGYESSSQFSKEYAKMFGLPPKKDIKNLRQIPAAKEIMKFS